MSAPRQRVEALLAEAFCKVAQHACRQGEAGTRNWIPLTSLPSPESWIDVGELYAQEFMSLVLEAVFRDCGASHLESDDTVQNSLPTSS